VNLYFTFVDKPIAVPILDEGSSTYDVLTGGMGDHLEPPMTDAAYYDLFNSESHANERTHTTDETQLAINSIVDYGMPEQAEPQIELTDSTNFFFDDLDLDNPTQENNQSGDDEASRAVQNLLGFT
jgi:hypothetical protein